MDMVLSAQYWKIVTLTSGGKRHERNIETARAWCHDFLLTELTKLLPQSSLDEPAIRRYLWDIIQSDSEHALHARLCLRCWISHQIAGACAKLSSKFGQRYGFTTIDLLPFVLDDDGTLEPSFSPFSLEILSQYDESKSSLSTWSYRKTEGHRDINLFLLDKGLYRISDWAILNDTPPGRLQRIFVGVDGQTLQEKVTLLQAFHQVYRRDRMQARLQTGSASRCLEPTHQQLSQMAQLIDTKPSLGSDLNRILSQLCDLAADLRSHRIAARRKMPVTQSLQALEETGYDFPQPDDSDSENDFLQRYRTSFLEGLNDAIKAITFKKCENYQKRNPSKAHLFVTALRLFHCEGLSMTVIAKVLDLPSQTAISRLIGLKQFRAEICAYWLNHLQENVRLEILQTMTPERLSQISTQVDAILAEETEAVMAEAAAEAQMPKNRTSNSTFSRHLCQELSGSTPA